MSKIYVSSVLSPSECDTIVSNLESGKYGKTFEPSGMFHTDPDTGKLHFFVQPDIRRSVEQYYDQSHHELQWLKHRVTSHMNAYQHIHGKLISQLDYSVGFRFLKYTADDNGFQDWHSDKSKQSRVLSASMQLSSGNDYEGGDLIFRSAVASRLVSRAQGDINIFPSEYDHKVTEMTAGTRYVLILWAEEYGEKLPDFDETDPRNIY